MQKQVKISGKSKENVSLLKYLKGDVQGKELVIEDSIVNERWKQVLKEKIDIENDLFNYQKNREISKVPFLPVDRLITNDEVDDILNTLTEVLPTGKFTSGSYLEQFENVLSTYLHKRYVIATSSGTDAIMIGLLALGLNRGDEVIMPANSFSATENAVLALGGVPIYVDINPQTFCIDPDKIEEAITPDTKFILPVHLYGKHSDMQHIRQIANHYKLKVIEDACQGIGLTDLGKYADITTLSFNPYKNFGVCGKAGAIATDNEELAKKCIQFSYHGFEVNVKNKKVINFGFNSKMDNLQAAIGLERMKYLSLNNFKRLFLADRYITQLAELQNKGFIELPELSEDHVWHLFPIKVRTEDRADIMTKLNEDFGVQTDVYYPILSHMQKTPLVQDKYAGLQLVHTEKAHSQVLHLPLYPSFTLEEQDRVMEGLFHVIKQEIGV